MAASPSVSVWEALLSALTVRVGMLRGGLGAPWLLWAVLTDHPIAQLILLVGRGEEVVNQAHSKHGHAGLLHQHGTGPQEQTEQQEEGRSRGGEALLCTALIQAPAKQIGHFLTNTWNTTGQYLSAMHLVQNKAGSGFTLQLFRTVKMVGPERWFSD